MQSKILRLSMVSLAVLALAGGAYYGWHRSQEDDKVDCLTVYGNVDIREAHLAFNGSEHIAEIRVQEGDRVNEGQLLARLHTALLEAQLAQARAELSAQRQEVAKLEAGSRPQEIDRARAQLKAAKARARAAEDTYRRLQQIFQQKLASPEDVEDARAKAEAAQGDREAAEQTLGLLVEGPRQEDLAAARAQLEAREAAVALARQRLDDASLHAPADGVIRDRILEPGDFATPQTPVLTLALLNPVWVRAYLAESALGRVVPGMKAEIHTDSYPGKNYHGWVGYISPTAEFTPKSVETPDLRTRLVYQIRVFACNPEDELRLGMPATVVIPLDQPQQAAGETDRCKE